MKLDTYSNEWRRITEARWFLRECEDTVKYARAVAEKRGEKAKDQLLRDVMLVRPHMDNFTKRVAAQLIEQMKGQGNER